MTKKDYGEKKKTEQKSDNIIINSYFSEFLFNYISITKKFI